MAVDAMEGRDVATCDLPGHFLQTDTEGEIMLRIDVVSNKWFTPYHHIALLRAYSNHYVFGSDSDLFSVEEESVPYRSLCSSRSFMSCMC